MLNVKLQFETVCFPWLINRLFVEHHPPKQISSKSRVIDAKKEVWKNPAISSRLLLLTLQLLESECICLQSERDCTNLTCMGENKKNYSLPVNTFAKSRALGILCSRQMNRWKSGLTTVTVDMFGAGQRQLFRSLVVKVVKMLQCGGSFQGMDILLLLIKSTFPQDNEP